MDWEWFESGLERGRRPWVTSKVAKKIALSILYNFRDYTCHEGSVVEVVVHMVVMKCSWRADLNGGPFADGPRLEHSVPIIRLLKTVPSKVHLCLFPFCLLHF